MVLRQRSKGEFDGMAIEKAFVEAARNDQSEAAMYLGNTEGHEVSAPSLNEAFDGEVSPAKLSQELLGTRGSVYPEVINEMFPYVGGHCSAAVVEFLYSTESVSVKCIDEAFRKAAEDNCIEVVEFLYKTEKIAQESFEETFFSAAKHYDLHLLYNMKYYLSGVKIELFVRKRTQF
ncbi:hypothetical protein ON010_g18514 [Phytophthora cinnamomi]|nr:hypothetical protein ON010_g18514 [Phytophthora cinnamomi]